MAQYDLVPVYISFLPLPRSTFNEIILQKSPTNVSNTFQKPRGVDNWK